MDLTELVAVAVVLFLGALTRSVFGFGDAAVAMPLLALLSVRVGTAVPLVGLVGLIIALLAALGGWTDVDRGALKRLTIATVVGVPAGVLLVTRGSQTLVVRSLGVLLLAHGVASILGPSWPRVRRGGWAYVSGFAAGWLGSAYNFNGVPVAVYGALRRWPPETFRSTLHAHFVISSMLVVAGQAAGGMWSGQMAGLLVAALPGVLLAVPLGGWLHRRIPAERFAVQVHGLVAVLGLVLLVRG